MRLYSGTIGEFINDTVQNRVADKVKESFENYYGRRANPREVVSWTNSLQFLKNTLEQNSPQDNMMILEYELPYSNERIDCILFGKGDDDSDNVVVMELKQWEKVKDCEIDENVLTYVGGGERMVPHPSVQVRGYHFHLKDFMDIFQEENVDLSSVVYCHNYPKDENSILFLPRFQNVLKEFPLFTKNDFQELGSYLKSKLEKGEGLELFNRFLKSNIAPSKKLIEHTKHMIDGQRVFNLIDEQITANNTIIDRAKKCSKLKNKSVIIIKGGPGTGKSVIALNALAELLSKELKVFHATGSSAFTRTLRKSLGTRTAKLLKFFHNFGQHSENEVDVLICDEAHRIRETSNLMYTKKELRSNTPQVDELIRASKVSVFFIDEYQIVRPSEVGNINLIKESAKKYSADLFEFELKTQFRCNGSDGYLNWVDDVLGIRETANMELTKNEKMDFRIFDNPKDLYGAIKKKNDEKTNSARLVAGFCWPWSKPNPNGTLVNDVVIGEFNMPWEGKEGRDCPRLAPGIPPAALWAYDPGGINQIGCVYTIQGFEFEYVGVIFGKDLVYNPEKKGWESYPENSSDPMVKRAKDEAFTNYLKNIYRVLLTRGMKGCYVYFVDKDTENFFRNRIGNLRDS